MGEQATSRGDLLNWALRCKALVQGISPTARGVPHRELILFMLEETLNGRPDISTRKFKDHGIESDSKAFKGAQRWFKRYVIPSMKSDETPEFARIWLPIRVSTVGSPAQYAVHRFVLSAEGDREVGPIVSSDLSEANMPPPHDVPSEQRGAQSGSHVSQMPSTMSVSIILSAIAAERSASVTAKRRGDYQRSLYSLVALCIAAGLVKFYPHSLEVAIRWLAQALRTMFGVG